MTICWDECTQLSKLTERVRTFKDQEKVNIRIENHGTKFRKARETITKKMQQAILFPEDVLGISIDDMANDKSLIPTF